MSKRDKSVIRRSVKREITKIKNLYFNTTSSDDISSIINTNNEVKVNFIVKLLPNHHLI
jgi:DNA-dependent RNA polymerase auxiliary subunit epsilon